MVMSSGSNNLISVVECKVNDYGNPIIEVEIVWILFYITISQYEKTIDVLTQTQCVNVPFIFLDVLASLKWVQNPLINPIKF